jgi:NADH-quinone oxidoreductase subunit N
MNASLMFLEILVALAGLGILIGDLWTPADQKKKLGYGAAAFLGILFFFSFNLEEGPIRYAFGGMYILDDLALFFKRVFLMSGAVVMVMAVQFSPKIRRGESEFYALILFALAGMMVASSAFDFSLLFVALELITITFYILASYLRSETTSLEAGVKYLILGALSSAVLVYGIALLFGSTSALSFVEITETLSQGSVTLASNPLAVAGAIMIFAGLAFKLAVFPFQFWAPDVYQGAPTPVTAFLAVGSKFAGMVLMMRVLFQALPSITVNWSAFLTTLAIFTILYGNLAAIPQKNFKRLMGYSSVAQAGYLMMGIVAMSVSGSSAILFYLVGYSVTVLSAFLALTICINATGSSDIRSLSGLMDRSPLLASTMTLAMISLAGIPPLVGFFGKFMLIQSLVESAPAGWGCLVAAAIIGVVASMYYYLAVVRAMIWDKPISGAEAQIEVAMPGKVLLYGGIIAMIYLGLFPNDIVQAAQKAASVFKF